MSAQLPLRSRQRAWTSGEIQKLKNNANLGAEACAAILGRSVKSVKRKAARERISLRTPGHRNGLILGQPRDQKWMDQEGMSPSRLKEIQRQAYAGEIDLGRLERMVIDRVRNPHRPLCAWCSTRPVEKASTGLCSACHFRELARAHRDEAERVAARRDLDAARQQASRARRNTPLTDDHEAQIIDLFGEPR